MRLTHSSSQVGGGTGDGALRLAAFASRAAERGEGEGELAGAFALRAVLGTRERRRDSCVRW